LDIGPIASSERLRRLIAVQSELGREGPWTWVTN
jgi:hypothetical protein